MKLNFYEFMFSLVKVIDNYRILSCGGDKTIKVSKVDVYFKLYFILTEWPFGHVMVRYYRCGIRLQLEEGNA